jgi:putative transposase
MGDGFLSDWVVGPDGQKVRIINIMDECSRRALWTEAHTSITAEKLIQMLEKLVAWHSLPSYIRCDNESEFIADVLQKWAEGKIDIRHIQPGKPSQNGLMERLIPFRVIQSQISRPATRYAVKY